METAKIIKYGIIGLVNDIDGDDDPLAGTGSYDRNRYRQW